MKIKAKPIMKKASQAQPMSLVGGPPFDGGFFSTVFKNRIQSLCAKQGAGVPVVLLQLSDGRVMDLCHIQLLTPRWMLAAVYREGTACEKMDVVFVPYAMIIGITVSSREIEERRVGFRFEASALTLKEDAAGSAKPG